MSLPFQSKLINLKELSRLSGVPYHLLNGTKIGRTGKRKKMPQTDKTKLANTMVKELNEFVADIGFEITLNRKEVSPEPRR